MRIAQVAPLYESVPPKLYGGTERVVAYLTDELVAQGHEVTLFASGDSQTAARLISPCPSALRLARLTPEVYHMLMLEQVFERHDQFDVIHFHCDFLHFPLSRRYGIANVTTLHGRLDLPDLVPLFRRFAEMPVVSISESQRDPLPWLNWQATVYHGLPSSEYRFHENGGDYLAFLGRISPEKGVDRAIEIALRAEMPLKIAAKVDRADAEYYEDRIRPLLDHPLIEFIGEVGGAEKEAFLGKASALLFPIDWPEPFGMVMIESLACGTPVIAFRRGSVPEVMVDGVSGFVVDSVDEAVDAVARIPELSRSECRSYFEQRFLVETMATRYHAVYEDILRDLGKPRRRASSRRRRVASKRQAAWRERQAGIVHVS